MQEVKNIFDYTDAHGCPFFFDKSEFVGTMHNAKCIMHNYMFLFVGAAIGSPFVIQTNPVGRVAFNPPIA